MHSTTCDTVHQYIQYSGFNLYCIFWGRLHIAYCKLGERVQLHNWYCYVTPHGMRECQHWLHNVHCSSFHLAWCSLANIQLLDKQWSISIDPFQCHFFFSSGYLRLLSNLVLQTPFSQECRIKIKLAGRVCVILSSKEKIPPAKTGRIPSQTHWMTKCVRSKLYIIDSFCTLY